MRRSLEVLGSREGKKRLVSLTTFILDKVMLLHPSDWKSSATLLGS